MSKALAIANAPPATDVAVSSVMICLRVALLLPLVVSCAHPHPVDRVERTYLTTSDTVQRGTAASDSAALALGLQPLRRAAVADGDQEIRYWSATHYGAEQTMLRLVRHRGAVDGMIGQWWRTQPAGVNAPAWEWRRVDENIRHRDAGRCGPFALYGEMGGCPFQFVRRPDWPAMMGSLERLGVWTLPDQHTLPSDGVFFADGWSMTVELRDGPRYRLYTYSNPDGHEAREQQAAATMRFVDLEAWGMMAPRTNDRVVRGRIEIGMGVLEITPCDSSTAWRMESLYGPNADSLYALLVRRPEVRHVRYAELRGTLAVPAVARVSAASHEQLLEVDSIVAVKEWGPKSCQR